VAQGRICLGGAAIVIETVKQVVEPTSGAASHLYVRYTDEAIVHHGVLDPSDAASSARPAGSRVPVAAASSTSPIWRAPAAPREFHRMHLHVEGSLHDGLSDREYQVMRMIAAGNPTRQIAEELALSVKTVGTYRARIFEKMRMRSPAELATYVIRSQLSD
jgi:DNA-binding NarL/FixJ family response regulator